MISKLVNLCKSILRCIVKAKCWIYLLISALMVGPYVYFIRYSFPAQDDFDYANNARELIESGYGVIGQAAHVTAEWHITWGGLYSSTFFGYLFSGIVQGDVIKLRIFEFVSAVFFIVSLAILVYALGCYIFNIIRKEWITVFSYLCVFLFGVAYYGDFDVFYWFITSVQYLMLLSFMHLGIAFFIFEVNSEKRSCKNVWFALSIVCGIIAAGANLCISGLNLFWYALIWLFVILVGKFKEQKETIVLPIVMFICSIINGLAPGNYRRSSGGRGLSQILLAGRSSVRFVLERIEMYLLKPEFWIAFIGLLLATIFIPRKKNALGFIIKWPVVIVVFLVGILAAVIFPAMLGYSYDVFVYLIRCQFVLDLTLFTFLVFGVLMLEQWFCDKYETDIIMVASKDIMIASIAIILGLCLQLRDNEWKWVGIARQYRDLDAGRERDFTNYYLSILDKVEKSESPIAVVYVDDEVVEKTSQINPLIGYDDCYDPEERYLNNAIAHFYKKKGVWVLHGDYVATKDDYKVAKKYGVEDQLK